MAIESFIKNSFRIHKTVFNSAFNISNLLAERVGSLMTVNVPTQYSDYVNKVRVYGDTLRENYRDTVNEGLDRFETFCFETVKRNKIH